MSSLGRGGFYPFTYRCCAQHASYCLTLPKLSPDGTETHNPRPMSYTLSQQGLTVCYNPKPQSIKAVCVFIFRSSQPAVNVYPTAGADSQCLPISSSVRCLSKSLLKMQYTPTLLKVVLSVITTVKAVLNLVKGLTCFLNKQYIPANILQAHLIHIWDFFLSAHYLLRSS